MKNTKRKITVMSALFPVIAALAFLLLSGCEPASEPTGQEAQTMEIQQTASSGIIEQSQISQAFPVLKISTRKGLNIDSRTEYTPVSTELTPAEGSEYPVLRKKAQMRIRGNTTAMLDKKPYRIKFDEAVQPLGLGNGAAKDWVLLAEFCDPSMVRNYTASYLAQRVLGDDYFAGDSAFVEVYINDEYQGIYVLTEQVETAKSRIDFPDEIDREAEQVGFLLELEQNIYRLTENGEVEDVDFFSVKTEEWGRLYFRVKTDNKEPHQIAEIKRMLIRGFEAISSGDYEKISRYFDVDAAARMYLIQAVGSDPDNINFSLFLYRAPNGKITFAAPWDFDLSFGNYCERNGTEDNNMFLPLLKLGEIPEIREKAVSLWNELRQGKFFETYTQELKALLANHQDAFARNFDRWNYWGVDYCCWMNRETLTYTSQTQALDFFFDWLNGRIAYLDTVFATGAPLPPAEVTTE